MGDEMQGMVVVDCDGHPSKYDQIEIMSNVVAKEINVFKIDVPSGSGWKRSFSEISTQDADLGESWCQDISAGAKYVLEETWVKASDPHYDAKVWPVSHPHGSGSHMSEINAGSFASYARNRSTLIQSWFRRTSRWAFWKLDCLIKNLLYNINSRRRKRGRPGPTMDEPDPMKRYFGTAIPTNIPDQTLKVS